VSTSRSTDSTSQTPNTQIWTSTTQQLLSISRDSQFLPPLAQTLSGLTAPELTQLISESKRLMAENQFLTLFSTGMTKLVLEIPLSVLFTVLLEIISSYLFMMLVKTRSVISWSTEEVTLNWTNLTTITILFNQELTTTTSDPSR